MKALVIAIVLASCASRPLGADVVTMSDTPPADMTMSDATTTDSPEQTIDGADVPDLAQLDEHAADVATIDTADMATIDTADASAIDAAPDAAPWSGHWRAMVDRTFRWTEPATMTQTQTAIVAGLDVDGALRVVSIDMGSADVCTVLYSLAGDLGTASPIGQTCHVGTLTYTLTRGTVTRDESGAAITVDLGWSAAGLIAGRMWRGTVDEHARGVR